MILGPNRTLTPLTANDNSKYGGPLGLGIPRRAGPPPGRKMTGAIDVIGANGLRQGDPNAPPGILQGPPGMGKPSPVKENVIQVC